MELPPFPAARATGWLAGFHWANPSTPLDAYCYVAKNGSERSGVPQTVDRQDAGFLHAS
jgi:hypothetical protein